MTGKEIVAFILILFMFTLLGAGIFAGYWFFFRTVAAVPLRPAGGDGHDHDDKEQSTRLRVKNAGLKTIWIDNINLNESLIKLGPNEYHDYNIPDSGLKSARVWARTGCKEDGTDCDTGQSMNPCPKDGCQPPFESKAEFTFAPINNKNDKTFYNISFVDGWTLPISILAKGSDVGKGECTNIDCSGLILDKCPSSDMLVGDLQVKKNGKIIGCMAPCQKARQPPPMGLGLSIETEPAVHMCCPTPEKYLGPDKKPTKECTWANACATSESCSDKSDPKSVVNTEYYKTIKNICPNGYGYAYDDNPNNVPVLMSCSPDTKFEVVFS